LLWLAALPARAATQWSEYRDLETLSVVTKDEDGSRRSTTVWIAVVDGVAYLRTSSTTWGANLARDPQAVLEIDGAEIPVRVTFVEDEPTREKVNDALRAKYGFADRMSGLVRFGRTRILRLSDR
jgi:hypothetical protein